MTSNHKLSWLRGGDKSLVIMIDGKTYNIRPDHKNYDGVVNELNRGAKDPSAVDVDALINLLDIKRAIESIAEGLVVVKGDNVYYDGMEIRNVVVDRLLQAIEDGFDYKPIMKFLDRLMKNPSMKAIEAVYIFLERKNLPITSDGYFLGYKNVRQNYLDWWSSTIDNTPGKEIPPIARNQVDDDTGKACSLGYHVGCLQYVDSYYSAESRRLLVKVDPADVVSVPSDAQANKIRVTYYKVLEEIERESYRDDNICKEDGTKIEAMPMEDEGVELNDWFGNGNENEDDGRDEDGYDENGYDRDGYDREGYDTFGYDQDGYDEDNYDMDGNHWYDDED
jgi:hypothetical protein